MSQNKREGYHHYNATNPSYTRNRNIITNYNLVLPTPGRYELDLNMAAPRNRSGQEHPGPNNVFHSATAANANMVSASPSRSNAGCSGNDAINTVPRSPLVRCFNPSASGMSGASHFSGSFIGTPPPGNGNQQNGTPRRSPMQSDMFASPGSRSSHGNSQAGTPNPPTPGPNF